jgi:type I restriction enzyme, S subunit
MSSETPPGWSRRPLGLLADYINGFGFSPDQWSDTGQPIVRIENMRDPEATPNFYDGSLPDRFKVVSGDLLLSWSATLMVLVWDRSPAWINQHIFKVVPRSGVDPTYLHHLLAAALEQLAGQSHGTTMKHVKRSALLPFNVLVAPISEQTSIGRILDTIDDAIRSTERLIAKLNLTKRGLLHDVLTRGIDENGRLRDPLRHPEQFVETQLGALPAAWELRPLREVADVSRGRFTHRPRNDPAFYGGEAPFIQTGDVAAANGSVITRASQSLSERGVAVSLEFPADTIAVTIAANIADTAILGRPMYFPDSVVGVEVKPSQSVRYVQLCIDAARPRLEARAPQSAQKNINLQDLRPMLIPVPHRSEQVAISSIYEAHAKEAASAVTTLEKISLLKQGLMDDLLTGRVRVNTHDEDAA